MDSDVTLKQDAEKAPTETLDLRSAPEPVGHTLSHPGAHQRVACVAGEDGGRSVHGQCPDLVAVWRSSEVAAGNDCKQNKSIQAENFKSTNIPSE